MEKSILNGIVLLLAIVLVSTVVIAPVNTDEVDRTSSIFIPVKAVTADSPIPVTERQLCRTDDGQLWSIWINDSISGLAMLSNSSDNGTTVWSRYKTTQGSPPDNTGIDCDKSTILAMYSVGSTGYFVTSQDYGKSFSYNSVSNVFGGSSTYNNAQVSVWIKNNRTYVLTMNASGSPLIHFDALNAGQSIDRTYHLATGEDTEDGGSFLSSQDTTRMVVLWAEDTSKDNDTVIIIALNDSGDMLQWKSNDNATIFGDKVELYEDPTIDTGDSFWCNGYNTDVFCTGTDYFGISLADYCMYNTSDSGDNWGAEDCHTPIFNTKGCLDASNAYEKSTGDKFFVGACDNNSLGHLIVAKYNGSWQTAINLTELFVPTSGEDRYFMPHASRFLDEGFIDIIVTDDDDKNLTYISLEVGTTAVATTTTIPDTVTKTEIKINNLGRLIFKEGMLRFKS